MIEALGVAVLTGFLQGLGFAIAIRLLGGLHVHQR